MGNGYLDWEEGSEPKDHVSAVITEIDKDRKINAIKILRAQFGVGLKEAKEFADAIQESRWANHVQKEQMDLEVKAHWNHVMELVQKLPVYSDNCAYCKTYYPRKCAGCPIQVTVGTIQCRNTPYYDVRDKLTALINAIAKQIEFLGDIHHD